MSPKRSQYPSPDIPRTILGRSYHSDEQWGHGTEPPVDAHLLAADVDRGLQFGQQWQQALKIDPQFIFVTGWNEWVAQRFTSGSGGGPGFLGRLLKPGETFFVDNYNEEFSRDIMPMKGGYGDNYYMQLVDGIRRFKGVRAPARRPRLPDDFRKGAVCGVGTRTAALLRRRR